MPRSNTSLPIAALSVIFVGIAVVTAVAFADSQPDFLDFKLSVLNVFFIAALSVSVLFNLADYDIPRRFKGLVRQWFLPSDSIVNIGVGEAFYNIFIAVYGRNHFSLRCLIASVLSSVLFFTIFISAIVSVLNPEDAEKVIALFREDPSKVINEFLLPNVIGDYFALWQTRYFLRLIKDRPKWTIPLIFVDIVLTLVIFFVTIAVVTAFIYEENVFMALSYNSLQETFFTERFSLEGKNGVDIATITLSNYLTTYVTSVWLWLVLFIGPIMRGLYWRNSGQTALGSFMRVVDRPIAALGFSISVLLIVVGILTWFAVLFV